MSECLLCGAAQLTGSERSCVDCGWPLTDAINDSLAAVDADVSAPVDDGVDLFGDDGAPGASLDIDLKLEELAAIKARVSFLLGAMTDEIRKHQAATTIQRAVRGHQARKAAAAAAQSPEFFQKLIAMHAANPARLATRLMVTQLEIVKRLSETPEGAAAVVHDQEVEALGNFVDDLFEGEMTYVELVAFADATYTVATNPTMMDGVASPEPHLTSSAWASMAGLIPVGISFYALTLAISKKWRGDGGSWSEIAEKGATFAITGTQMGAQATSGIAGFTNATTIAATAGSVAVGANLVAGLYQTITASQEYYATTMVGSRYEKCMKQPSFAARLNDAKSKKDKSDIDYLLSKVVNKCYRRRYRADVNITSGLASTSGAGVGFALMGGASGAAVPIVGWICLGIAMVGGFGLLGYSIARRQRKIKKLTLMDRKECLPIPDFLETSGDYNRYHVAMFIFFGLLLKGSGDQPVFEKASVWAWILFGGTMEAATATARSLGVHGIMGYIKRG